MALSIRRSATRKTKPVEIIQQLVNTPLDVLIEIFLLLEPLDLLHLARTTKGLREFLLSRNKCSALWKTAISNVDGLPPCPDYISAPAYAHLAFVPVCHGCFGPCETVEWELRMRCCPTCFPKMTMLPSFAFRTSYSYVNRVDLPTAFNHDELDINHAFDVTVHTVPFPPSFSWLDWNVAKGRKRPKNVPMEEFLDEQNEYWASIRKHARLCRDWGLGRLRDKAARLSRVRRQRLEDIKDKLKRSGWKASELSVYCDDGFLRLQEVRKLEPLTPTEWTEIRPQIVGWLERAREKSIWRDRIGLFNTALMRMREELQNDTSLKVLPLNIDAAMIPPVRSLMEGSIRSDVSDDDMLKKLYRILPREIRTWSASVVEELERHARGQLDLPRLSKPCRLPWVIFQCRTCNKRFRFDDALSHPHLYQGSRGVKKPSNLSAYEKRMGYGFRPRDSRILRVDVTISRRIENLVRRMGQNPDRVTYDELHRSTIKLACGLCHSEAMVKMDFGLAFAHCLDTHLRDKETKIWTRVSGKKESAIAAD